MLAVEKLTLKQLLAKCAAIKERRNDVAIEQRNCNLQLGELRGGIRLAVSLVGSASNGDVISTLRAGCHFNLAPTTSRKPVIFP